MVSPPSSPLAGRTRPQSMYSTTSPETTQRIRPQSMIGRTPRSSSRMSMTSSRAGTRLSDEDVKTAVKVVVRVRPPLGPSDPGFDLIPQRFQKSMLTVNTNTSLAVDSPQGRKIFIFDRVFGSDTSQKGVFEYLEDSVDSFLQGYNVSILAYGQSGSGKSYTMGTSGPAHQFDPSSKGVIPRAAAHLFDSLSGTSNGASQSRTVSALSNIRTPTRYSVGHSNQVTYSPRAANVFDKGWEMTVTYVEIYNEQPRDLLLPETASSHERPTVQIREDLKGRIFVEGLKSVPVNSIEELMAVLNHGSSIRQTDATALNSQSSRSHAIFTVNLRQNKTSGTASPPKDKRASVPIDSAVNGDVPVTVESKLHFVDLAGSERLKNTQATGDRAREGISINAGLASLGKVISQLSSRSAGGHVSYRDSKLTRILQDSLGGNAITYMVACVTPAEFHLSETLNTVQYAQRARNIQSKPKIQQVNEDADKQALIDRLKSEVAFLRQQIRSSESGDRRSTIVVDRQQDREIELQNSLLDAQENYNTLSQRHAKLISELTKSHEVGDSSQQLNGESAMDRLKRSQENQHQIEQVVWEYEKTIQSLEVSLQTTRSTLADSQSSLLERETKCAYMETMNQQLNTRIQKLMDRETNTEKYLHELEKRLEDQSSGGEKHDAVITELRKEMSRIRENETNAEDYICTLEERLAEADQDMETMSREVERLEQLVERQRSLGKLDTLLHELDHLQQNGEPTETVRTPVRALPKTNGVHSRPHSVGPLESLREAEEHDNDTRSEDFIEEAEQLSESETPASILTPRLKQTATLATPCQEHEEEPSPAQQKYVADQFESVSQELFDLKIEHESTVNELDLMSAKYQEALRTLAEMQDAFDESRHGSTRNFATPEDISRPVSVSGTEKLQTTKDGERMPSSRSLSSELSLADESLASLEPSDATFVSKKQVTSETPSEEVEKLQQMLTEHERSMTAMSEQYSQLQMDHSDALRTVEKLKSDIQRSRQTTPQSPAFGPSMPSMIRRMTSNVSSGIDRGQRSIISLRTILAEELDGKSDLLEAAEVHLSAATQELSTRMERIQSLEGEVKSTKKEMDMKSTIIAGLARERHSIKGGTPVDLSIVSQMRDQLIQKETELKALHEGFARREQTLMKEMERLTAESNSRAVAEDAGLVENGEHVSVLRDQLADLTTKHEAAERDAIAVEKKLAVTLAQLETTQASIEIMKKEQEKALETASPDSEHSKQLATTSVAQTEQQNYDQTVAQLKRELEDQTSVNASQMEKISSLTQSHAAASKELVEHKDVIEATNLQIKQHKDQVADLEKKMREAESAVEFHKHGLKSLHDTHASEIEEMKLTHANTLAQYDDKVTELISDHEQQLRSREIDAQSSKKALQQVVEGAGSVFGHATSQNMLVNHIQDLVQMRDHVSETNQRLVSTNAELEKQLAGRQSLQELEASLESANNKIANYQATIKDLANEIGNHEETIREKENVVVKHEETIETLTSENQKKIALIEELEQQLQSSFEQNTSNVSVVQAQGNQALIEAQQRIASLEKDLQRVSVAGSEDSRTNTMKSQNRPQSPAAAENAQRSNSLTSNLRKSASITSLPSPPPAIPLPPLPNLPGINMNQAANPSPPQSRHTSKEGPMSTLSGTTGAATTKDNTRRHSAVIEDQESRIRTMEKHLHAEKQLTATLEEALVDLETQSNKLRVDAENWKKKAWTMEEELASVRKERRNERLSVQAVEEEVKKRREAEAARAQLEERMRLLTTDSQGKKKKTRGALNCF